MEFNPHLRSALLIKRYKRFLADVVTPQGDSLTIHCANTGAMTGCATPEDTVWYSTSTSVTRKYPHSWELIVTRQNDWICVNTLRANGLVREALMAGHIAELCGYDTVLTEVEYGLENSRIDFLLRAKNRRDCYVEVKSVTLLQQGQGYFPDAVSKRGQRHLRELTQIALSGQRAVLFFAVMHSGIKNVLPAGHIDAHYTELIEKARKSGVEMLYYKTRLSPKGMQLHSTMQI